MTGWFETLVYTDCRPGQGLEGGPGLQFQARSGADAWAAAEVVRRSLLYEPPQQWMLEQLPAEVYPLSLAHSGDGLLVTARGRYLGTEANGSREGNQLTHAVVSTDPAAYGLVRPAQLLGATFWADAPAPTTTCPRVRLDGDLGAFAAETLQGFVRTEPYGEEWLTALLSAVRLVSDAGAAGAGAGAGSAGVAGVDAAGVDAAGAGAAAAVVFVGTDPVPVLRWLAAATLLVPQRRALGLGFKVFTTDPAYAEHRVLAVHPEWGAAVEVDNDLGLLVFDLVHGTHTTVPSAPAAAGWVELFLRADPYDVVDAVEVAGASGLDGRAALAVAGAAVLGIAPGLAEAEEVVGWLAAGPEDVVRAYGGAVAVALLAGPSGQEVEVLRGVDGVTAGGRFPGLAGPVRLALLRAELAAATSATAEGPPTVEEPGTRSTDDARPAPGRRGVGAGADETLPALPEDTAKVGEQGRDLVLAALSDAVGPAFDAVLRLVTRHGVEVAAADIAGSAGRFVADWADHPDRLYAAERWPCRAELLDALRDVLIERLAADPGSAGTVGADWWPVLADDVPDLDDPLSAAVVSAAARHAPREARRRLVDRHLDRAMASAAPMRAFAHAVAVLWRHREFTLTDLELVAARAPAGARLPAHAVRCLLDDHHGPDVDAPTDAHADAHADARALDLCQRLEKKDLLPLPPDPDLVRLLADDGHLDQLCRQLPRAGELRCAELAGQLTALSAAVLRARSSRVADALLAALPRAALVVLAGAPPCTRKDYLDRLPVRLAVTATRVRDQGVAGRRGPDGAGDGAGAGDAGHPAGAAGSGAADAGRVAGAAAASAFCVWRTPELSTAFGRSLPRVLERWRRHADDAVLAEAGRRVARTDQALRADWDRWVSSRRDRRWTPWRS